jgi:hypothetical protein
MEQGAMIWTAWNNGQHFSSGAGYGFKIPIADRDAYFDRSWKTVILELPAESGTHGVEANVNKASFWGPKCRELINKGIGRWLIERGHAPWEKGDPPRFEVIAAGHRRFVLKGVLTK